jgi:hypothetical protein
MSHSISAIAATMNAVDARAGGVVAGRADGRLQPAGMVLFRVLHRDHARYPGCADRKLCRGARPDQTFRRRTAQFGVPSRLRQPARRRLTLSDRARTAKLEAPIEARITAPASGADRLTYGVAPSAGGQDTNAGYIVGGEGFFRRLPNRLHVPRVTVTDKLRSHGVAKRQLLPEVEHRHSRYLINRAEIHIAQHGAENGRCSGSSRWSRCRPFRYYVASATTHSFKCRPLAFIVSAVGRTSR